VQCLLIHRPAKHGYSSNSGSQPAEELTKLVEEKGGKVVQPFTGVNGWNDSFVIAGPTEDFYKEMLAEQTKRAKKAAHVPSFAERFLGTTAAKTMQKLLASFPVEIRFGDAGGDNPRNNSSAILSLMIDGKHLIFPGDAGVPALSAGMDHLDAVGRTENWPAIFVLPHHGSRHNLDRDTIQRILGSHATKQYGNAVASVSQDSDGPSPRVANAAGRRGYPVTATTGRSVLFRSDAPLRLGWEAPVAPLPPLAETDLDED
jgi:hypothetical protein